ncbi:histidine phosphatase family protein [Thalassospira sp. HF15]|uniref:histidine phosphatase family protein n=1 Tax=Thalassospira sp. HF15 TaxID=2722755 RepID=UPI0014321FD6|nr:histidine phosphatase family protein [Thalassospira sp. HF15]NIY74863.1 histidine phosphatase family protein [Thalassospira sp. HF15]
MARHFAALVRHGDYHQRENVPSAHQPFALTACGEQQAHDAAKTLAKLATDLGAEIDPVIDSSQMLRAWATADIIATTLTGDFSVICHDALAERSVGALANLSISEINQIVDADPRFDPLPEGWKSDSHFRLPFQGAESLMQSGERVAAHLTKHMKEFPTRDTLKVFVGHGASFRHAAHHLGVLRFDEIAALSMYHARPVVLEHHADCTWYHVAGDWKVRAKAEPVLD